MIATEEKLSSPDAQLDASSKMNGAEAIVGTLVSGGVDVCFTNPGTSEIHIVAALDQCPEMRCVLGLFEGVVTGAADGYARMSQKPACTLLHLGPGLANGLANLHNAWRAQVPIINIVGQHATYHLRHDTPLCSDIEGLARPYSQWYRTCSAAAQAGRDAADAIAAAGSTPGRIATFIVPADAAWDRGGRIAAVPRLAKAPVPAVETIEQAARLLRNKVPTALLITGNALYGSGLEVAGKISQATRAKLMVPYPFARLERGAGKPTVERVPYVLEQAVEKLNNFRQLILVGASTPTSYFAYPDKEAVLTPTDCKVFELSSPQCDSAETLRLLAEALEISNPFTSGEPAERPFMPTGGITLPGLAAAIAATLPDNSIVVDESMTSGRGIMAATKGCPPHDWLANTGGSIGIALPMAVGAAVAKPNRRLLCLSADGSGMYTVQSLWTMAREALNITKVIFSNRVYSVLKREFANLCGAPPGPKALDLFEIGQPDLDWVAMAKGMGVPAIRISSLEEFSKALQSSFAAEGPMLIDIPL